MADYTTPDALDALAGTLAVDLRTDDAVTADLAADAIGYAAGEIDFAAQGRWGGLDAVPWVRNAATHLALEWLSLRRFNAAAESLVKRCDEYRRLLDLVAQGKRTIPGAARSRRPIAVSNTSTDLRRFNNQTRVDQNRSTGVAKDYRRPTDPTSPDGR